MAIECVALPNVRGKKAARVITRRCSLVGCESLARSNSAATCEKHYYRKRRTGYYDDPVHKVRWRSNNGYITVPTEPHHPLNGTCGSGRSYEHRVVLYDAIGPGEHPCFWCRRPVRWDVSRGPNKLVVDHLDGVKSNNNRENLVSACHECNAQRGLFVSWVRRHRDDPFLHRLFSAARRDAGQMVLAV